MGRTKKEFNRDGIFQIRFREQFNEKCKSQGELAEALGVSRPTVAGWLDGRNIPDILSLTAMAQYFNVSADYLLGLSETTSFDVNLRATAQYTGLSEEAIKWLHRGFDDAGWIGIGIKASEEEKKQNLQTASELIENVHFREMLDALIDLSEAATLAELAEILCDQYWDFKSTGEKTTFCFAKKEEREDLVASMIRTYRRGRLFQGEKILDKVNEMSDEELMEYLSNSIFAVRDENEIRQFWASKAFSKYVDRCVRNRRREVRRKLDN